MKYFRLALALLPLFLFACSSKKTATVDEVVIVPQPVNMVLNEGSFSLDNETNWIFPEDLESGIDQYISDYIQNRLGFEDVSSENDGLSVSFKLDPEFLSEHGEEAYKITVTDSEITVLAGTEAGFFYAFQTFRQLLPAEVESEEGVEADIYLIPALEILDFPKFPHRGMLLDCCRHFMDKEFVLRYIDLLAYHKMNVLHWHLTEDQGWRIEIKKYPKLTEVGAWRTNEDGTRYGGFYTQEDVKEVVAYAAERHITVIPEIEMPGHSTAALAAYPEYSCTGGPFEVEHRWGVHKDIYCAGNDSTFIFLKDILDEVMELFPSKYIHIGGDEAPKVRWEECSKCQQRIKDEHLEDEHHLQSWFISEMNDYLKSKGRVLIGWDEIIEGGLTPGAIVQSWRGFDGAAHAVEQGNSTIVSPTSHAYFDYPIAKLTMEKVYSFDPIPAGIDVEKSDKILGGECNMWTERAPQETIDSKVFPRILAMSEVLWTYPQDRDYQEFKERVRKHYARLDALGVNYGLEQGGLSFVTNNKDGKIEVEMIPEQDNIQIRYTTDGTDPDANSDLYSEILVVEDVLNIKAAAFKDDKMLSEIYGREYNVHQAIGGSYSMTPEPSNFYSLRKETALTDGRMGTEGFHDGLWLGWQGTDVEVVMPWEAGKEINSITIGFLQSNPSWVFIPASVEIWMKTTEGDYTKFAELTHDVPLKKVSNHIEKLSWEANKLSDITEIKIIAKNAGPCPEWHPGAGGKSWVFIDEIIVE